MNSNMLARIRGFFAPDFQEGGAAGELQANNRGELLVAMGSPALSEVVRMGETYRVFGGQTSALTAAPTTTAGFSLWNGEADGGKHYVIHSFGVLENGIDATQQNSLALWALVDALRVTAVIDAGNTIGSNSGRRSYGGLGRTINGATVVNTCWIPVGPTSPSNAQAAGSTFRVTEHVCNGLWICPPGCKFSVAASKTAATSNQLFYFMTWHEMALKVRSSG